jgi:hypothetical protein
VDALSGGARPLQAIQKAVARLPEWLLEEAARCFAEFVSGNRMESVVDSTGFALACCETRVVGLQQTRVKRTVKLSACWDAEKRVFHAFRCLGGNAHAGKTLLPMVREVRKRVSKCYADVEFSSRKNVQGLADAGIESVIKPQESAKPRSKGCPAWKRHIRRYRRLGYERWRDEAGYGKRFQNEGTFGALITRFGDTLRAKSLAVASKLIGARIVVHNLFASLVHGV